MKAFLVVTCLLVNAIPKGAAQEETFMKEVSQLLQNVAIRNESVNTEIKHKISELFQKINSTLPSTRNQEVALNIFAIKTTFCKKALLYIKDNVKREKGAEVCDDCVKELDVNPVENVFSFFAFPNGLNDTDDIIAGLLMDAAVSLKAIKGDQQLEAYKKTLFCKAHRIFDPSEVHNPLPEDTVDLNILLANVTNLLRNVDPTNKTSNTFIATKISKSLEILDPVVCKEGAAPLDRYRTIKKIHLCQKALIFLKDNVTKPGKRVDCGDCIKYPDTRPLIHLLSDFKPEAAREMNENIGKVLVDVAVVLKSLPEEEFDYVEYRKLLDFNIGRLSLIW